MSTAITSKQLDFKKIGPRVARSMSDALQKLTAEKITVKFDSIDTNERSAVVVDCGEKCFGCHATFRMPAGVARGVATVVFPTSSVKTLVELLFRRFLGGSDGLDPRMKLSAFREMASILLQACIAETANALKNKVITDVPKFAYFRRMEFAKPLRADGRSDAESKISLGQFKITGPEDVSPIKARLIIAL